MAAYHSIINAGLRANPAPPEAPGSPKKRGRKKQRKARNLLLRLASRWRQVLAFMKVSRRYQGRSVAPKELSRSAEPDPMSPRS